MAGGLNATWRNGGDGADAQGKGPDGGLLIIGALALIAIVSFAAAFTLIFASASTGGPGTATLDAEFVPPARIEPTSSISQSPDTAASSWSAGPTPVVPVNPPRATDDAIVLAGQAADEYGIGIALEGEDWGEDAATQVAAVEAVMSAMDRLPETVTSSVVAAPAGPLSFVSNRQGITLGGWQPFGDGPATFFTNSDWGPAGYSPSNQIVLATGADTMTIAHEVLHAYQSRNVGPDEYALTLLGPEMRSFMAATGWRQVGTDAQVRAAVNQPFEVMDALFVYEGRALTYDSGEGSGVTLTPPNPFEAFAVTGALYYARPSSTPLPDWPEYWAWFESNLG